MTKNTLLNFAITLSKVGKTLIILVIIGLTIVFVHLQLDRSYYSSKKINVGTNSSGYFLSTKHKVNTKADYNEIFTVDKLKTGSIYFIYLRSLGVLVILFLSLKEFQKVMQSVKGVKTFGEDNVASFRRIGRLLIVFAILTSYTSISFENGRFIGISLPFIALFLVLFSFIMAEIFKEGVVLKEEYELTI